MNEIILVGAGGHASACVDVIELSGQYNIAGLVDKPKLIMQEHLGYSVIGSDEDLPNLRQKYEYALVTVGQIKSPLIRFRLFQLLLELGYKLPVISSPISHISKHSQVGSGSIIMHDVIINANARIGTNCIINNKALIEHDAIVGNDCHIAPGAIINGQVSIGNKSFIGSGSIIKQSISIGNNCVIGAGTTVKTDIKSGNLIK